jgi:hypothetical protein
MWARRGVNTCKSGYMGNRNGRIMVWGLLEQKISKTPCTQTKAQWILPIIRVIWEAEVGGSCSETYPGQKCKHPN